ncbi:MAG: OsmC family protein [Phycisphaerae bacterium]|nr:OsmC family protein [Phycisphaerae bacterium]
MPLHETETELGLVNGIDVDRLKETLRSVKERPDRAKFRLRAHNRWIDGTHCQTTIKDFYGAGQEDASRTVSFALHADEPDALLGHDHGPNATEATLHALAACLNTTFICHAAAMGISVEELELELEGDIDLQGFLGVAPHVRSGYGNIRVLFRVKADAPPEKIEQLCDLARRRSPVFDIVTHETPVSVSVERL